MKAINSQGMRESNRQRILSLIRGGGLARADLARKTGLTRAAVTIIVEELVRQGLVEEKEKREMQKGRSSVLLGINPAARCALGLNISRRGISAGVVDLGGGISDYGSMEYGGEDTAALLSNIDGMVEARLARAGADRVLGLGVTVPGPVAGPYQLSAPDFERLGGVDLTAHLGRHNLPVRVENNSKAIAVAEHSYGRGEENFLELVVDGSGLGGGIVLDGALFEAGGLGSEVGHVTVDMAGPLCKCGNRGCAELYASIPNLLRYAKECGARANSYRELADKASDGDTACSRALDYEADYLAACVVSTLNIVDVPSVVLYGDVTYRARLLAERLERRVNERYIARALRTISVNGSLLGNGADVLAAANLVLERFFQGESGG